MRFIFLVLFFISIAVPSSATTDVFQLTVLASDNGFENIEGDNINNKSWEIKKGSIVEITFKFIGDMDEESEEHHEIHMRLMRYENGKKPDKKLVLKRLSPLSATEKEQVIRFTAGEFLEKIIKIYCKTDCDGMDFMDKLTFRII